MHYINLSSDRSRDARRSFWHNSAMSTEVAAGQEASAEMEGKRGMLGGLADTAKEVISLPFEPVVGGRPANVSFRLLALGIIVAWASPHSSTPRRPGECR
jgi:hypothetical protein